MKTQKLSSAIAALLASLSLAYADHEPVNPAPSPVQVCDKEISQNLSQARVHMDALRSTMNYLVNRVKTPNWQAVKTGEEVVVYLPGRNLKPIRQDNIRLAYVLPRESYFEDQLVAAYDQASGVAVNLRLALNLRLVSRLRSYSSFRDAWNLLYQNSLVQNEAQTFQATLDSLAQDAVNLQAQYLEAITYQTNPGQLAVKLSGFITTALSVQKRLAALEHLHNAIKAYMNSQCLSETGMPSAPTPLPVSPVPVEPRR